MMRREPLSLDRGARESLTALADAGGRQWWLRWVDARRRGFGPLAGRVQAQRRGLSAMWLCGLGMVARRALAGVGALVGVAVWCLLGASSSALAASPVVVTFSPSSNVQEFTPPAGVTVNLTVQGGGGGSGCLGGQRVARVGAARRSREPGWSRLIRLWISVSGRLEGTGAPPSGGVGLISQPTSRRAVPAEATATVGRGGAGGQGDLCGGGGGGGGGCDSSVAVEYP